MKAYTKPIAEKVDFEFKNQVVASGKTPCTNTQTISKTVPQGSADICMEEGQIVPNW